MGKFQMVFRMRSLDLSKENVLTVCFLITEMT